MSKEWIIEPPWDGCGEAAVRWNLPPLVTQILYNRKITTPEAAKRFIDPQLRDLHPPEQLPGAKEAAERLASAVRSGRTIVLYGDYDVDGITGVAILWHLLRCAGVEARYYVPHRVEEGYGVHVEALESIARDGGQTVVTVDCGITAVAQAEAARDLGLELIITDHHQPGESLPAAAAIVHPQTGAGYPNHALCGAGVAFKLGWAFAQAMSGSDRVDDNYRRCLTDLLPLAALGTIADVVPLVDENRILARCGLALIHECPIPGLQALIEVAELRDAVIDGAAVGFKLGPLLNAAGRLGHARLAMDLMTHADALRAREIALYLQDHNRARQSKQRKHVQEACRMVEQAGLDGDTRRAIVLSAEGWHPGLIGVVAGRLVEKYHKPAVLIAMGNGEGQGSARSVPHFDLHAALAACGEHLLSHGGHAQAAGLKIDREKLPAFTEAFEREAVNALSGRSAVARLAIDGVVDLPELDERTVTAVRNLGPFGAGNPQPLLATDWVSLMDEPRCVGRNSEHLQLKVGEDGATMRGIAFGGGVHAEALRTHRRCRVAFEPVINTFKGRTSVEMQVVDFKFPDEG